MPTATVPHRFSDPAQYILHPTDFSPGSELAFAHALRMALANRCSLTLMHVGEGEPQEVDWESFPSVRATLQRWGLLEEGAKRSDVAKLGIQVEKINVFDKNVTDAIAGFQRQRPIDMLVLATEQRQGLAGWLNARTAEEASRKMGVPTLFVPAGGAGCVSLQDGHVTMQQVLIPVDQVPAASGAIERGLRAIAAFGDAQSKLTLLYVGKEEHFPVVNVPAGPWQVVRSCRQGHPVTEILAAAKESHANLLIMVTKGTDGILDMLRGTTTEQVLRQAPCPILAIPAHF